MKTAANGNTRLLEASVLWAAVLAAALGKAAVATRQTLYSDIAQPAVVFFDMIGNSNYLLRDWYIVTNSQLLTEFPLYVLLGIIFGMDGLTLRIGSVLVFALSVGLLGAVAYRVAGPRAAAAAALSALSATTFSSLLLLAQYTHIATVGYSFLCLLVLLGAINRGRGGVIRYAAIFLICLATVFSDPYFIFCFIIPAVAAYLALIALGKRPLGIGAELSFLLIFIGSAILGLKAQGWVHALGLNISRLPSEHISPAQFVKNVSEYFKALSSVLGLWPGEGTVAERILSIPRLALFVLAWGTGAMAIKGEKDPAKRFACIFFLFVSIVLSGSFLLKAQTAPRYLIPLVYATAFFISLIISGTYLRNRALGTAALGLLVVVSCGSAYEGLSYRPESGYQGLLMKLKAEGLTYGYSNYWHSNVITALSGNSVKARPVDFSRYRIEPFYWVSNSRWYRPSAHEGPTFLMVPNEETRYGFKMLTPEILAQMFGPPERAINAEGVRIYVWPYNIMKALLPSVEISVNTPHNTGRFEQPQGPGSGIMHALKGKSGLLLYGQHWRLGPGTYRARFMLHVDGPRGAEAARLDIQRTDLGAAEFRPEVVSSLSIAASEYPGWAEYALDFDVKDKKGGEVAHELRVFVTGEADVMLRSVTLEGP